MELENLRRKNALQIELLNVIINKTLLAVLKEQQAILTSLGFPYFDHVLTVSSLAELDGPKLAAEMDQIIKQKRIISAALSLRMKPKMLLANGLSRTPLSDGKKRKKTRRKLSIGDTNGVEITTESTEYSPAAEFDPILSGTPAKRLRVESVPSPASAISIYGPGGDSGVKTSEVVTKPTAASAAGINPASLPLLQQLAKMLQKNKKNAQTASGNVSNNGNDDNSVPSVLSPSA